jgi:hypothetical protein
MFIGERLRQPHDCLGSVSSQVGHGFAEVVVVRAAKLVFDHRQRSIRKTSCQNVRSKYAANHLGRFELDLEIERSGKARQILRLTEPRRERAVLA